MRHEGLIRPGQRLQPGKMLEMRISVLIKSSLHFAGQSLCHPPSAAVTSTDTMVSASLLNRHHLAQGQKEIQASLLPDPGVAEYFW